MKTTTYPISDLVDGKLVPSTIEYVNNVLVAVGEKAGGGLYFRLVRVGGRNEDTHPIQVRGGKFFFGSITIPEEAINEFFTTGSPVVF